MNSKTEPKKKVTADYSDVALIEMPFCEIADHAGVMQTCKLDLITSKEKPAKPTPVVLFLHGGGFVPPCDKRQAYVSLFARHLTQAGYAVAAPDYPLFDSPAQRAASGGLPAGAAKAGEAVHKAYRYLVENGERLGLDTSRVAIMGGSAGGMAAFHALASYRDSYKAFVNLWGAPNPVPDLSGFPPTLSVHGTADPSVPYSWEKPIQKSFEEKGVWHRLISLEGAGHTPLDRIDEYLPPILTLLTERFVF